MLIITAGKKHNAHAMAQKITKKIKLPNVVKKLKEQAKSIEEAIKVVIAPDMTDKPIDASACCILSSLSSKPDSLYA